MASAKAVGFILSGFGWPSVKELSRASEPEYPEAVAACAEGYSFPTNLDRDPPLGGLAPKTQAQLMHEALEGNWSDDAFEKALAAQAEKKLS